MLWCSRTRRRSLRRSIRGDPGPAIPPRSGRPLTRAFEVHGAFIADFLARPPQTNEVGRSAVLLGGFLTVAAETGLPLRLLEIGASAGLNLIWDAYAYDLADAAWGPPAAPLRLRPDWQGALPPLIPAAIRGRRGCDRAPLDPSDAGDRLRLRAYVWADQVDRRHRLEVALDLVAESGLRVERADAAEWAEARLREPAPGEADRPLSLDRLAISAGGRAASDRRRDRACRRPGDVGLPARLAAHGARA